MVHSLVILRRDLKAGIGAGRLLHQPVSLVFKLLARAVPVHHKAADVQLFGPGNLLPQHVGIMAGIADINVRFLPEPRLINRQQPRAAFRRAPLRRQRLARIDLGRAASRTSHHKQREHREAKQRDGPEIRSTPQAREHLLSEAGPSCASKARKWSSSRENCFGDRDKSALHDLPTARNDVFITSSWMKQQQFWMDRGNSHHGGADAEKTRGMEVIADIADTARHRRDRQSKPLTTKATKKHEGTRKAAASPGSKCVSPLES